MNRTALSDRAHLLHLKSQALADGMRSGSFKSLYKGQGIELNGVREYLRGDDVRSIDWNVTARMNRPFVKVFEEERELDVFIILDKSLSMKTGSSKKTRLETAVECASLLTFACQHNESPVGTVIFDGGIIFSSAPVSSSSHTLLLLSKFEKNLTNKTDTEEISTPGSALGKALQGAAKLLKKKTLVVVISDFRTGNWKDSFSVLCNKNDVLALRISDPLDENLPSIGAVNFSDMESGRTMVLPTSSATFSRAWREKNRKKLSDWKSFCLSRGATPYVISTENDVCAALINLFNARRSL